ncbi:MAG: RtcB family protein [Bacteroidia bacterium]
MENKVKRTNVFVEMGFPEGRVIGMLNVLFEGNQLSEIEKENLCKLLENPGDFLNDIKLGEVASLLIKVQESSEVISLKEKSESFAIYGKNGIEEGAINQMNIAMRLPITVSGALMPDAHQGYGLPIGGVLATRNAIIPYGVGVDIGCRMALSVYDIPEDFYLDNKAKFKRELIAMTKFGAGNAWKGRDLANHAVLDNSLFDDIPLLKGLKDKAHGQLGTSGGGNHFVEFGIIEFKDDVAEYQMKKGRYLSLLTHSGSRGFGATIAGHYTRLAKDLCKLPQEAQNLAYLDLNSQEGLEYWLAMNLAGDYASACHEIIHQRMSKAIGAEVLNKVENHHNFAWKEMVNGEELIVHRKGATPASKGILGIIPGSMTAPGFLVRGKGEVNSIQSASHGAGRLMSRTQATKTISKNEMKQILKEHQVDLIGAGLDEAPMAYKNIHEVMKAQTDLVDVLATFYPRLVRMADDGSRED